MRQLSGQDASFLYLDSPNGEVHGTMVFIYDPSSAPKQPIGFKDILRHVESRLSLLGRRRRVRHRISRPPHGAAQAVRLAPVLHSRLASERAAAEPAAAA